jgi:hypothetical protein
MQRLLDLIKAAISAVLGKLKRLVIHIIKHPLGSLWWTVKMYFALMFFSLFVACSFGAFATETCSYGSVVSGVGCGITPKDGAVYKINYAGKTAGGSSAGDALNNLIKQYTGAGVCNGGTGTSSSSLDGQPSLSGRTNGNPAYYTAAFNLKTACTWEQTNPYVPGGKETVTQNFTSSHFGISIIETQGKSCDFDTEPQNKFTSLQKVNNVEWCIKPFDILNNCFKESKYIIGPQFHYAQSDAGAGKVCVESDSGELCPWKEVSGGNGVFEPDRDSQLACDLPPSIPDPAPQDPDQCFLTGSGFKACKADPNDKCTVNSTNALSCGNSCGYLNGEFMCFTQRDPTVDPNKPDPTPRPDKDDTITDPQKALSDMVKGDFKQIQRGVETRLDGFTADMANLMKSQEYAATQANKNSAQGNKLLNSINQNTANTVEELKKLSDAGADVEGITKPEFEDKNDWSTRNFGTVLKEKADQLMQIPVMQSVSSFFNVGFSGTCPTYNVTVWVFEININQFCSPEVQALFPYIRAVVLLMCSFFAIRVALL